VGKNGIVGAWAQNIEKYHNWKEAGQRQYGSWTHVVDPSRNPAGCANETHCQTLVNERCDYSQVSEECLEAYQSLRNIEQGNPKDAVWLCQTNNEVQDKGETTQHINCDKVDVAPQEVKQGKKQQVRIPDCIACP